MIPYDTNYTLCWNISMTNMYFLYDDSFPNHSMLILDIIWYLSSLIIQTIKVFENKISIKFSTLLFILVPVRLRFMQALHQDFSMFFCWVDFPGWKMARGNFLSLGRLVKMEQRENEKFWEKFWAIFLWRESRHLWVQKDIFQICVLGKLRSNKICWYIHINGTSVSCSSSNEIKNNCLLTALWSDKRRKSSEA